jgi:hypothetical protein
MRFGVQRQQTLLVTTELVIWRYANALIFTNQSELDFGIAYVPLSEWSVIIFAFLILPFILLLILNLIVKITSAE